LYFWGRVAGAKSLFENDCGRGRSYPSRARKEKRFQMLFYAEADACEVTISSTMRPSNSVMLRSAHRA